MPRSPPVQGSSQDEGESVELTETGFATPTSPTQDASTGPTQLWPIQPASQATVSAAERDRLADPCRGLWRVGCIGGD